MIKTFWQVSVIICLLLIAGAGFQRLVGKYPNGFPIITVRGVH